MEYGIFFGSKTKCSAAEKKHAMLLIKEILGLSKKARTAGFIVLGQNVNSIKNSFLRDGIKLIGKGYDYSAVEKILDIKIAVRNTEGIHLLEMAIIKEGILSILRGDPLSLTEEILFSFLGPEIYKSHVEKQDHDFGEYLRLIAQSEHKAVTEAGRWILDARDNEISFLLKAFDWKDLAVLLRDETASVLYRIYSNLSNESGKLFKERLSVLKPPAPKEVARAENRFTNIVMKINSARVVVPALN